MNKYKIISMAAAALIIVAGCLYLWLGTSVLLPVLILSIVAICIMGGANAQETKAAGNASFISYIPAICFFVLAAFVTAALVFFLIK